AEVDEIFALITKGDSDKNTAWDEDEEKDVILYTAYVDGAKVEYLKHKGFENNIDDSTTLQKGPDIVELKLSGGKLKAVEAVTSSAIKEGKAGTGRVTNSITDTKGTAIETDDVTYFLADDVVIYVLEDDGVTFDKVGAKSDIRGKNFKIYDVVDDDDDYDIVVVWPDAAEDDEEDEEPGDGTYTFGGINGLIDGNRFVILDGVTYPYVGDPDFSDVEEGEEVRATFNTIRGETVVTALEAPEGI
ncbi:MAG: hypothetical protein GYA02_12415, partial [Clostridiaceae bacterium]|nr:hypothetical protein [Clostridiaceae bacterium]